MIELELKPRSIVPNGILLALIFTLYLNMGQKFEEKNIS